MSLGLVFMSVAMSSLEIAFKAVLTSSQVLRQVGIVNILYGRPLKFCVFDGAVMSCIKLFQELM